jgi:branched-chain amino acid transport system ATP-binding protein
VTEPALIVEGLRLGYGDLTVVWDVSLEVHPGRTTALVGRNGAGKTTLLSGIAGLLKIKAGSVKLHGEDITKLPPWKRAHRGIVLVQEGKRILRTLTVEENLALVLNGMKVPRGQHAARYDEAYERFPVLSERRTASAGSLSGGQQQMLAIAQALVAKPSVLLIDEPSSGLAPVVVIEILKIIDQMKSDGIGILLVEQLLAEVLSGVAQDVVLLERGKVVLSEPAERLTIADLAKGIFN